MGLIIERAKRLFDLVPAVLVVESPAYELHDEGASSTSTRAPIEFSHSLIIKMNVQTHVLKPTHGSVYTRFRLQGAG